MLMVLGVVLLLLGCKNQQEKPSVKFVSFPDFFNFDIPEPWPKYDEAVDYFPGKVKDENPNFVCRCQIQNSAWACRLVGRFENTLIEYAENMRRKRKQFL